MKSSLLVIVLIFVANLLYGQALPSSMSSNTIGGISLGSAIAVVASWSRNKSVLWAIIHAILGWIYVIYYVITRSSENS